MIGPDWLRRKAADAVRIEEARPATVTLAIDNRDSRFTTLTPTAALVFEGDVSRADEEQIREQIQITARPTAPSSLPMRCPCGVIYSRCYYGH